MATHDAVSRELLYGLAKADAITRQRVTESNFEKIAALRYAPTSARYKACVNAFESALKQTRLPNSDNDEQLHVYHSYPIECGSKMDDECNCLKFGEPAY